MNSSNKKTLINFLLLLFLICTSIVNASDINCYSAISSIYRNSDQVKSLKESLERMNVRSSTTNSYSDLGKLSAKNLEEYILTNSSVSAEVSEVVDSLEIIFVHNRSHPRTGEPIEGDRLLSSRKLGRGAQNTYNYNREFLKSDDNVFFFVKFIGKDFPRHQARRFGMSYGGLGLHLNKEYGFQHGWISPFNMYPRELANFLNMRQKHSAAQAQLKAFRNSGTDATETELAKLPTEILSELSKATFTPMNFESLVKTNLKYALMSLKHSSSQEYEHIIDTLIEGEPNKIDLILKKYVFEPLGLADSKKIKQEMFEFKVPSHVPKEFIKIYD